MRIKSSTLTQKKKSLLHQSATRPPMYISIEDYRNNSESNAIVYLIEIGFQFGDEIEIIKCEKRYSELYQLHQEIKPIFKNAINQPVFPPKKFFYNKDKSFLNERKEGLQNYFRGVIQFSTILRSVIFKEFFGITLDTRSSESSPSASAIDQLPGLVLSN